MRVIKVDLNRQQEEDFLERFKSKLEVNKASPLVKGKHCLEFTGRRDKDGYGITSVLAISHRAHRVSYYYLSEGEPLSESKPFVCHHCDNPVCCEPAHMYAGSQQENHDDKVKRNRTAKGAEHGTYTKPELRVKGEKVGTSKLTTAAVLDIRVRARRGEHYKSIMNLHNIQKSQVSNIIAGRVWKHITEEMVDEYEQSLSEK